MGTLRLTFIEGLADREQARILGALRKLKATPTIRPIHDTGTQTWVFTTDPLPAPKKRARKPGSLPAYLKPPLSDRQWAAQYRAKLLHAIETATLPCEAPSALARYRRFLERQSLDLGAHCSSERPRCCGRRRAQLHHRTTRPIPVTKGRTTNAQCS